MAMVIVSVAGVVVISVVVIALASDHDSASQLVFTAVLPLFGTWVGTVLAYYFAKENLKTATETTRRLLGSLPDETLVTEVMIRWQNINKLETTETDLLARRVDTLSEDLKSFTRLPVFDKGGKNALAVIHRSSLNAFLLTDINSRNAMTFAEFAASPEGANARAFGVVAQGATVREARQTMGAKRERKDIFVTASGKADEAVVGWITDSDLAGLDT
jgi:CBS domain-containing protein